MAELQEELKKVIPSGSAIKLRSFGEYDTKFHPTAEVRQMMMKYTDPLNLNFKLLLNIHQETGLFGGAYKLFNTEGNVSTNPEDYPQDSALAYLLRIGDKVRFTLLVSFIYEMVDLVKNYDFLVMEVAGLEEIPAAKPEAAWVDAHINVTFRETINSRVQRTLSKYVNIYYDSYRGVVVLPRNMQSIDIGVLLYNAGYFLSEKYDEDETVTDADEIMERKMFPTIKKLQQLDPTKMTNDSGKEPYPFIYHLFRFKSAYIDPQSGTKYFESVSNDPGASEFVKTNLQWSFYGVVYSSCFRQGIDKEIDIVKAMTFCQMTHDADAFFTMAKMEMPQMLKTQKNSYHQDTFASLFVDSAFDGISDAVNGTIGSVMNGKTANMIRKTISGIKSRIKSWENWPREFMAQYTAKLLKLIQKGDEWLADELTSTDTYAWLSKNFPYAEYTGGLQGFQTPTLGNGKMLSEPPIDNGSRYSTATAESHNQPETITYQQTITPLDQQPPTHRHSGKEKLQPQKQMQTTIFKRKGF